jgi:peptidoglycan/LPS O-acetylase OafA/YrhL
MARRLYLGWPLPTFGDLLLNMSFLFSFVPGKQESLVAAGWSIGIEMAFYAALPLMVLLLKNIKTAAAGFVITFIASIASSLNLHSLGLHRTFDWMNPATQLPFFVAGILCFHIFRWIETNRPDQKRMIALILLIGSPAALWLTGRWGLGIHVGNWSFDRYYIGLLVMPLVLAFALYPLRVLVNPVTIYIGKISYGIYLMHPFVIVTGAKFVQTQLIANGHTGMATSLPVLAFLIVATSVLAAASYKWMENPIMVLEKTIRRRRLDPNIPATA